MKKIMILGAGIYQVPLIRAAKEMGFFVIVVSIKGDYPGFALADKIYYINTTDREAVLKAAVSEKIDGICTTGTDVAVSSIGYVCEHMELSGISEKAADLVTDLTAEFKALHEELDSSYREEAPQEPVPQVTSSVPYEDYAKYLTVFLLS